MAGKTRAELLHPYRQSTGEKQKNRNRLITPVMAFAVISLVFLGAVAFASQGAGSAADVGPIAPVDFSQSQPAWLIHYEGEPPGLQIEVTGASSGAFRETVMDVVSNYPEMREISRRLDNDDVIVFSETAGLMTPALPGLAGRPKVLPEVAGLMERTPAIGPNGDPMTELIIQILARGPMIHLYASDFHVSPAIWGGDLDEMARTIRRIDGVHEFLHVGSMHQGPIEATDQLSKFFAESGVKPKLPAGFKADKIYVNGLDVIFVDKGGAQVEFRGGEELVTDWLERVITERHDPKAKFLHQFVSASDSDLLAQLDRLNFNGKLYDQLFALQARPNNQAKRLADFQKIIAASQLAYLKRNFAGAAFSDQLKAAAEKYAADFVQQALDLEQFINVSQVYMVPEGGGCQVGRRQDILALVVMDKDWQLRLPLAA